MLITQDPTLIIKFDGFLTIGKTPEENKRLGLNARTPGRNVVPNIPSYVSEIDMEALILKKMKLI